MFLTGLLNKIFKKPIKTETPVIEEQIEKTPKLEAPIHKTEAPILVRPSDTISSKNEFISEPTVEQSKYYRTKEPVLKCPKEHLPDFEKYEFKKEQVCKSIVHYMIYRNKNVKKELPTYDCDDLLNDIKILVYKQGKEEYRDRNYIIFCMFFGLGYEKSYSAVEISEIFDMAKQYIYVRMETIFKRLMLYSKYSEFKKVSVFFGPPRRRRMPYQRPPALPNNSDL